MILRLGRSFLLMERPSFSSGSKIRQGAENLHRDAESGGTENANYHFRHSALTLQLLEFYVLCAHYKEITSAVENSLGELSIWRPSSLLH